MGIDQLCVMGIFLGETSQHSKIHQPNSLRTYLMIFFFQFTTCIDYSRTPLNKQPSTADTEYNEQLWKSRLPFQLLKQPLNTRHLTSYNKQFSCSHYTVSSLWKYTGSPWVRETSLQGTKRCLPMVSVIEEFHCSFIPVALVFDHLQ